MLEYLYYIRRYVPLSLSHCQPDDVFSGQQLIEKYAEIKHGQSTMPIRRRSERPLRDAGHSVPLLPRKFDLWGGDSAFQKNSGLVAPPSPLAETARSTGVFLKHVVHRWSGVTSPVCKVSEPKAQFLRIRSVFWHLRQESERSTPSAERNNETYCFRKIQISREKAQKDGLHQKTRMSSTGWPKKVSHYH